MLHSYNQQSWDTREQVSKLLSFSRSFSLLKLSSKNNNNKKNKNAGHWLQRVVGLAATLCC
jgi:hypothetical protein